MDWHVDSAGSSGEGVDDSGDSMRVNAPGTQAAAGGEPEQRDGPETAEGEEDEEELETQEEEEEEPSASQKLWPVKAIVCSTHLPLLGG
jgi:hypothetical protein